MSEKELPSKLLNELEEAVGDSLPQVRSFKSIKGKTGIVDCSFLFILFELCECGNDIKQFEDNYKASE